jgi:DNA ligase-1
MSAYWIHKLNESDSRLHKEDVIKQAYEMAVLGNDSCVRFLQFVNLTYNPYVNFYLRQVPEISEATGRENPWSEFNLLLFDLMNRKFTGNAARDAVDAMSQRFDSDEWNNFCRNVIRKDLRCGISDKTFNKVVKKSEYEIPIFGCQLATNSEGRPEMKGLKRLEPKLDGVRVLMRVSYNDFGECVTTCYSRNGKIFENFNLIEQQITDNYTKLIRAAGDRSLNDGFWLDGEVIGNSFQELMRQARRKDDVDARDSVFNIFDIIPSDDWERGYWNAQLHKRMSLLEKLRPVIDKMSQVELLPHIMVDLDTGEGRDQLMRYAKDMVNAGFEGIMIKDINSPYECKRNTFWMKWKPTITVDLEVIGLEEGTGRNVGRLGALVCSGVDDGKTINVNVGSGFSDSDRDSLWASHVELDCVIGRKVEVLCDVITQNQDGTYSLRFPRFVRFRDDK